MKILGITGEDNYLLVEDGVDELQAGTEGRVLDDQSNKLYPWQNAHAIVTRGYWEEYEGDQSKLDDMLNDAEEVTY